MKCLILTLFVICLASRINGEGEDCQNDKEEINLKFEVQNDQDTQSDERFVAVHVDQMGVDELNPDLPQIHDIVRPFLPANSKFSYALNATREIVNGFKYEIIFVMKNEHDDEIYCEMDVLEKPWLMRDSKKFRKMTYNNCSLTNPADDDDRMRFQYDINPTFVNQRTEPSLGDLSDMEDQIVTMKPKVTTTTKPRRVTTTTEAGGFESTSEEADLLPSTTEEVDLFASTTVEAGSVVSTMKIETTTEDDEDATLAPLDASSKNLLDDFFNMNNFFPPPPATTTSTTTMAPLSDSNLNALDEMFGVKKVSNSQAEPKLDESSGDDDLQQKRVENVQTISSRNETALKDLEIEIKKVFSELFQTDPEFQMNIIALINRNDNSNAQKNYNYVISILTNKLKDKIENFNERRSDDDEQQVTVDPLNEDIRSKRETYVRDLTEGALGTLDHIDVDDKKRVLLNIISVKGKKNSLKVEAAIADSHCKENSHEIGKCGEKIERDSVKVCLLEISEVNGELKNSACVPVNRVARGNNEIVGIPGGVNPLDKNDGDVKLYLDEALTEINAGEDPDYSVKEILEASTQVVSGSLVKFRAVLLVGGSEVTCHFEVWEQSWLPNGRQTKVNCDNAKTYSLTQMPVYQREKSRTRRDNSVGALQPVDKNDEKVLKLLETHLKRLDTGSDASFELVSVEEVTKRVVSGLSYTVNGTFRAGEDEAKQCSIEIWTRPWIDGDDGTQIKAECEDGLRLKTKRTKRSARPMPGRHEKFHSKETSDLKAREMKSEVLFENFVKKYHRRYANDLEHKMRHRIFKKNLHKIDMLNKHEQGTAKYGITPFADNTEKEYLHKTGLVVRQGRENELRNPTADIPDIDVKDLPEEFDWTEKAAVTSVKNQENCGSCWSFSVTGNIEGLNAIKTGKLEAYSEQELLDCDTTDNACNGGYMDDAFKAIEKIGGLELESEYPYKAKKQKKCQFNATLSHVKVKGVVDMPKGDEVSMQKYLVQNGPISIGINAAAMQFYRGGVSHPWKILCRKSDLDHGVLLVGYGIKTYPLFNKTLPYWKIKNSWGPKWGEQGFYRIYRGDNSCGVAEMASSAVLE